MPALHYVGLGYAWFPLISAAVWFGILVALLSIWTAQGRPMYERGEGSVVYISDVGADNKTLFICGTSITGAFFVVSLCIERWLRHKARLDRNIRNREKWLSVAAIFFAAAGSACLIGLSIKDAFNYDTIHWRLTIGFIVCVALSAIFTCAEWGWLNSDYEAARYLRFSYLLKLLIILCAIAFAIVMGVYFGGDTTRSQSIAAIMEWTIAFLFDAYLWTLVFDLFPAVYTKHSQRFNPDETKPHRLHLHRPDMSTVGDRV